MADLPLHARWPSLALAALATAVGVQACVKVPEPDAFAFKTAAAFQAADATADGADTAQAADAKDVSNGDALAPAGDAGPDAVDLCIGLTTCDDGNPCTDDGACVPATGCSHTAKAGACDDKDPCTSGDACAAGKCVGKPAYPEPVIVTTPDEQWFRGGVVQPDGSLVVAEVKQAAGKQTSRLLSLDATGVTGKLNTKLSGLDQTVEAIVGDGSGWAVAGTVAGKDVLFARVSATGVVQAEVALDLGATEEAYGLAKAGNQYAVVGYSGTAPAVAFLVLLDKDGVCVQNCKTFYKGGDNGTANAISGVTVLDDGSFLAAGESQQPTSGIDGYVWHLAANGKVLWQKGYGGLGQDRFWSAPRKGQGGSWVVYGGKNNEGWLLAIDGTGKQLWETTLPGLKDLEELRDLQPAPFGWVAAGPQPGGQMLVGTDPVGNVLWQRTFLGTPFYVLTIPTGFAVVGDIQGDSRVVFTDPWGHQTCQEAGACLGVTGCDDKTACTDDYCTAKSGCVHVPASDGQPCGAGGVCGGGKCVP